MNEKHEVPTSSKSLVRGEEGDSQMASYRRITYHSVSPGTSPSLPHPPPQHGIICLEEKSPSTLKANQSINYLFFIPSPHQPC